MKFLICAAGSGGHIYPALSLADKLKTIDKNIEIVFFTAQKAIDKQILNEQDYKIIRVGFVSPYSATGFNSIKFYLKNLYFLLKFIVESIRVFFLVRIISPDLIIGFGGISSVTAILSAKFFNIPSLIHEQNILPGLANRVLSRVSTEITLGYEESNAYFKPREGIVTGNPLRYDLEKLEKTKALNSLELDQNKFTILVFGGSQGSEFINQCFLDALKRLAPEKLKLIQVIHCAGIKNSNFLETEYKKLTLNHRVFAYCDMMSDAYSAADLVIGRAGAATLNEICYFQKASILIPYPFAGAHQKFNAKFMQDKGAACLVEQNVHCQEHMLHLINTCLDYRHIPESMAEKSRELFKNDGSLKLANVAINLVRD